MASDDEDDVMSFLKKTCGFFRHYLIWAFASRCSALRFTVVELCFSLCMQLMYCVCVCINSTAACLLLSGSLLNLAKHPASTVQILGAEKALFRALKTRRDTPKYGLIYHASLVGQTSAKIKGKVKHRIAHAWHLQLKDIFSSNCLCSSNGLYGLFAKMAVMMTTYCQCSWNPPCGLISHYLIWASGKCSFFRPVYITDLFTCS